MSQAAFGVGITTVSILATAWLVAPGILLGRGAEQAAPVVAGSER